MKNVLSKRSAIQFVILIGIVSLFADMTYEGADADFIFLDDSLNVQATVIAGELAWKKPY